MSDDNNSHYRSSDPYGQAPAHSSDPLAELARLIGQNDPFSEFGRESRAPAPQQHDTRYAEAAPQHDAHYAEPAPPREVSYDRPATNDWQQQPAAPAYEPYAHQAPVAPEPQYDNAHYSEAHMQPPAESYQQPASGPYGAPHTGYDAPAYGHESGQDFQPAPFASQPTQFPPQTSFQPPAYPQDDSQASQPDEYYDDAPPEGRRKGLVTVVAVLGLAVVGTAGAFGYRSLFGSSHASGPPPVIRASTEPTRVAPPPQANNDSSASKLSYDRFGDRTQNEEVKVREEQPLDIKDLAARAIANQPAAPAVSNVATVAPAPAGNPPSVLTEPKRVRTVQIHPEQQEAVAPRQPLPQPVNAAPPPAPRPTTVAVAMPPPAANAPTSLAPDAPPRAPAPHMVRAAPVRAAAVQPEPSANAPLSLSPAANNAPAPQPVSTRSAPKLASIAPVASGHYLVQVSSQRSEADAQSSYRSIQAKYGSVLGDRHPVIRKADLGAKGTYYRAMVGPFASRADAISLCGNLKAAGGDCVVQGN